MYLKLDYKYNSIYIKGDKDKSQIRSTAESRTESRTESRFNMTYKSALENVYVCISQDEMDNIGTDMNSEELLQSICADMGGKHNVILNTTDGYRRDKDILISDKELKISEDIGLGEGYTGSAAYVVYNLKDITAEYCEHIYARKMHMPAYILETENYIVREECEDDLAELYELYEGLKDCSYIEPLYAVEQEKEFLKNYIRNMYYFFDYGLWLVYDKRTGKLAGRIGIENRSIDGINCQELGYLVGKEYQHRGAAYEVCLAVIEYARDYLGIESLYACIHKENLPSICLITKLGFKVYAYDVEEMNIYIKNIKL